MLIKRAAKSGGVKIEYRDVEAVGEDGAKAHWDASYKFSATNRDVVNRIDARFTFDGDGLILHHVDSFDFWTWAGQALGVVGTLLGWFPPFHASVQAKARAGLDAWMAKSSSGEGAAS